MTHEEALALASKPADDDEVAEAWDTAQKYPANFEVQGTLCARIHQDAKRIKAMEFAGTQATNCCRCGQMKHTPWRDVDGYVCAGCLGDAYDALRELVRLKRLKDQHRHYWALPHTQEQIEARNEYDRSRVPAWDAAFAVFPDKV